ncbi:hypothetical protein H8M03_06725 [Sphingomonas sabuli]|uniref:Uncharacterized protein n=1 Tax=Sphingomonas sabuli TaxID=2764186 RepID=A0A7G9KZG4_9SPHN|nr:hypothetical protein [Sphingomonas sabuli]QNM81763.1 hypothetical protein H8M03_06725 [Sphingomonas sabuli]
MSFDYFVAVPAKAWPSSIALQQAIDRFEYPVRLRDLSDGNFDAPTRELAVQFEGRPVIIEAEVEEAKDADDPQSLFGYIAQAAVGTFAIQNGDQFLTLTFRSDADEIRAGLYIAAALINGFGGYGFENQTESHGRADFAAQMVREASNENLWID